MINNGNSSQDKNSVESIKKVIKNIKDNETPSKSYDESLSIKDHNSKIESLKSNSLNNQISNVNDEANKKDDIKIEEIIGNNNQNIQLIDTKQNEDTKSNTWFFEKYLDDKFKSIDSELSNMSQEMTTLNTGMDGLNNRMTTLNTGMDGLNNRMTTLNTGMDSLNNKMTTLNKGMDGLNNKMTTLNKGMDGLNNKMTTLNDGMTNVKEEIVNMNTGLTRVIINLNQNLQKNFQYFFLFLSILMIVIALMLYYVKK